MGGHRDVILLVGGGRDRVDARGISALFVFGDQRRGGHLRHHEARVEARTRRQERRQAGESGINQHSDAPLGERTDLTNRQRKNVGGERDGLGVEVAAGERRVVFGENERVVGNPVRLVFQRARGLANEIEAGAHHLRLATQAIGVLHARIVMQVRGADRAARHQRSEAIGDVDLAAMAAQRVNARIERRVGAAGGVGRERARRQRGEKRALGSQTGRRAHAPSKTACR